MAAVELLALTKVYDGGTPALDGISLTAADGEFLVLLGPSGCGKSTILRCIAGLETPTAGEIRVGGARVDDLPPGDRDVAMVFQNYALYPHMSVRENVAFPLRMRRMPKAEIERRVRDAAGLLGLTELLERRPGQLSGGERQRTALGRAIVREPRAFLFDEPLSNLDAKLRAEMRRELTRLHRRLGATMVYVTHDQTEAMTMGQRIAVLRAGRLLQVGTPTEIYARPAGEFVARFIGTPGMNILTGEAVGRFGGRHVGFRPEDARFRAADGADFRGRVTLVEPLGSETLVHVALDGGDDAVIRVREGTVPALDDVVGLAVPADRRHHFDPTTGDRV